jgi:hypothetical protein
MLYENMDLLGGEIMSNTDSNNRKIQTNKEL